MLDMLFSLRARMLAATLSGFHPAFMMDFEDEARPDAYFTHLSHVAVGKSAALVSAVDGVTAVHNAAVR
jgi:hypothetical protein